MKQDGCFVDYAFHLIVPGAKCIPMIEEAAKIERSFKLFTVYNNMKVDSAEDLFNIMTEIARVNSIAMVHCEND